MEELILAIKELKKLLSDKGKYSVCRTDKSPMHLGDLLIVGEAMERVDNAIEAVEQCVQSDTLEACAKCGRYHSEFTRC